MRVLHLPFNIASQNSTTVRALRDIGVDARGLAKAGVVTDNNYITTYPRESRIGNPLALLQRYSVTLGLIAWADVLHYHFGVVLNGARDLRFAQRLGKKICVEFWGSDIRIGAIESADNPIFAALPKDEPAVAGGTAERSYKLQKLFAEAGARAILPCPSLAPSLDRTLFPNYYSTRQRIYLSDYEPLYEPDNPRPVVLHSPTSRLMKGSDAVQAAVESLQARGLDFEYRLVENTTHSEALKLMAGCDVYVDQLVAGSHGLAALEAMALGKPVICYIKPSMTTQYPPELPIVSATPDSVAEVLAELLADPQRRSELGRRGREYVERYHDAQLLARELAEFYATL